MEKPLRKFDAARWTDSTTSPQGKRWLEKSEGGPGLTGRSLLGRGGLEHSSSQTSLLKSVRTGGGERIKPTGSLKH